LEVGYVGNHGTRLNGITDINQFLPGASARPFDTVNDAAGNPMNYLNFINRYSNPSFSNYHSLQATLTKRVSHGLSFTGGYTYGHGLDNNSENRFGPLPQDSGNPRADYASGDFDVRHRFTFTAGYALPGIKGFAQMLEGWKINSIVTLQTAQPWNIGDTGNDFSGGGDLNDRWNFTGNPADFKSGANSIMYCTGPGDAGCSTTSGIYNTTLCGAALGTALDGSGACDAATSTALFTKCQTADAAFVTSAVAGAVGSSNLLAGGGGCFLGGNSVLTPNTTGHFGSMGRNIFRDNGFRNWDLSVFKTFTFKERYSAQFRVELFNILNRPTISNPNGANNGGHTGDDPSGANTFGCGCGTPDFVTGNPFIGSGSSRQLQVGLKLQF
jgi:hypothetical protein